MLYDKEFEEFRKWGKDYVPWAEGKSPVELTLPPISVETEELATAILLAKELTSRIRD